MKLGSTYYYHMQDDGTFARDADMDRDSPCQIRDSRCMPTAAASWHCANWAGEVEVAGGAAVRLRYPTDAELRAALTRAR